MALAAGNACAQYGSEVYFGDSSIDAGFFGGARFTVNPGLVFPQVLGQRYGVAITSSSQGGTDYGAGGARVAQLPGYPPIPPTNAAPPLSTQIAAFLGSGRAVDPNALYGVSIGYNDIFTNLDAIGAGLITPEQAQAAIAQAAVQAAQQIALLQAAGARYVVVLNLYDTGISPAGRANPSVPFTAVTNLYNSTLTGALAQAGVQYIYVDTSRLFHEVAANPAAFGFVNVTQSACTVPVSLLCTPATLVAPDAAQTYLFADPVHPTPAGHAIMAAVVASMLEGPAKIGVLAEAPLAVEQATFRAIDGRMISAVGAPPTQGKFQAWASYDYGNNDFDGPFVSGNADVNTIAAGGDLRLSEQLLVGVAFSYSENKGDFGGGSGGYKLKEPTGTVYVGYGGGPWYVGATLGAGDLDYSDVHRNLQLGALGRTESGEARGWHVMGSVLGGYWFNYANWLHGPFVRLSYQEIHVKAFSERGSDSTALSYGEQERKSLVSTLGWQVAGQIGNVRPFARIAWEFESKDDQRFVSAALVGFDGSYSVPVIRPDDNFFRYALGASADFGRVTGYLVGSATSSRSDGNGYGITVGLRVPL
ncbi:MAG TPA: autotransporter domain-containing protein [Casimicrobiaceae bacterium]